MNQVKSADDYKMRWKCMDKGCYLDKVEPRLWDFQHCFPRNMSMGDIDGIVEIKGKFLVVEWKSVGGKLTTGQHILLKNLTAMSSDIIAYVLYGNSQTMDVYEMRRYFCGQWEDTPTNRDQVEHLFKCWSRMASL